MKRTLSLLLALILCLSACASQGDTPSPSEPEPTESDASPTPSPSEEPSPVEELTETPVCGLHDLLFRLLIEGGGCPDWPNIKSKGWVDSAALWFVDDTEALFGVDPSQYERTAAAYWDPESDAGVSYTEASYSITLFQTAMEEQANALIPVIKEHQKNAEVTQTGQYVAVFLCDDSAQLSLMLRRYARSSDTAGYFLRYEEGKSQPVFEDPDPNYPDRELFDPPNEEDMSIYDTSAILSAWEKGDPAGLSDYDREIYDAAKAVLEEIITDGMNDLEKETAVYTWITQNVDYDWSHMDILTETSRDAYGPYGGLVNHAAVCLGYATTFQLLMDMLDIECLTVVGAAVHNTGDHAWNMVRINGNWYGVDVTWDANGREQIGEDYQWQYFNITSDELAEMRQWDYVNVPEAVTEGKGG